MEFLNSQITFQRVQSSEVQPWLKLQRLNTIKNQSDFKAKAQLFEHQKPIQPNKLQRLSIKKDQRELLTSTTTDSNQLSSPFNFLKTKVKKSISTQSLICIEIPNEEQNDQIISMDSSWTNFNQVPSQIKKIIAESKQLHVQNHKLIKKMQTIQNSQQIQINSKKIEIDQIQMDIKMSNFIEQSQKRYRQFILNEAKNVKQLMAISQQRALQNKKNVEKINQLQQQLKSYQRKVQQAQKVKIFFHQRLEQLQSIGDQSSIILLSSQQPKQKVSNTPNSSKDGKKIKNFEQLLLEQELKRIKQKNNSLQACRIQNQKLLKQYQKRFAAIQKQNKLIQRQNQLKKRQDQLVKRQKEILNSKLSMKNQQQDKFHMDLVQMIIKQKEQIFRWLLFGQQFKQVVENYKKQWSRQKIQNTKQHLKESNQTHISKESQQKNKIKQQERPTFGQLKEQHQNKSKQNRLKPQQTTFQNSELMEANSLLKFIKNLLNSQTEVKPNKILCQKY